MGVYATNAYGHWANVELTKDCGTIPFLLHKFYGYDAILFGQKAGEYPNQQYIPGVRLDFLPSGENYIQYQCEYIEANHQQMDVLLLHGPYPMYIPLLRTYRRLRADGRVYLALDANSYWMDSIAWDTQDFRWLLNNCDVIATSCRAMQRYLNRKWPCTVHYIPNGFYNYSRADLTVDYSQKENTILTVGRIGSGQKNSGLLLYSFLMIADRLPSWKVKFVGTIEPSFRSEIERLLSRYPSASQQVEFTGPILDRAILMSEYKKAKIFALTSVFEGGSPNVFAEALFGGCYIVTSAIDAAEDMVDDGRCGVICHEDHLFSSTLLQIATDDERLRTGSAHAVAYGHRSFDFCRIIRQVHYLLFGEA